MPNYGSAMSPSLYSACIMGRRHYYGFIINGLEVHEEAANYKSHEFTSLRLLNLNDRSSHKAFYRYRWGDIFRYSATYVVDKFWFCVI